MVSDEDFRQELEQIQNTIDRQASNSFKIKGWTVTLVVVALLFRSNDTEFFVGFIPLFGFWYLDAYYLKQEKKFRKLYDWVREERPDNDDYLFDMAPKRFDDKVGNTAELMLSETLMWFYGTIGVLLVLYAIIVVLPV